MREAVEQLPRLAHLVESHVRDLTASGLSTETILEAEMYSAPERQVRDVLGYGAGPGMVIPYRDVATGVSNGYARVKLDHPGTDGTRYRSPAQQPNRIYLPPSLDRKVLADISAPIWITEGEKKALKAAQEGLVCIALPGVWSWRTRTADQKSVAVADLDAITWRGRTVYIVFDSDLATNPSVRLAEFELARELARRVATVKAVRLPGGPSGAKVGLDDYLLTHSVEALCQLEPVEIHNPKIRQGPVIVTARELLARTFAEQPAIVGGGVIVRQSFVIVGGPPKRGKSSLVMNQAIRRSLGEPWLSFPTTRGRTLILQAEIPERELQSRLRLMLRERGLEIPEKSLYFVTHRGLRLDRSEGLQVCRRLVETVKPDLLVIDPLARFFSGDENSAREIGRLVGAIDDLIQTYGLAVELVHHTAKPNAQDPREGGLRLRGSSALFGAADSVLLLDRDEDAFKLSFELRHGKEPEPMRLERADALWFVPTGPAEDLMAVASVVRDMGLRYSALVGHVKQDTGGSDRTAERLVARARKAGLIATDDDGLYRPTVRYRQLIGDGNANAGA